MTIINPNSISGITSVTAEADIINFYKSDGNQAGLGLNGVNFNTTAGISTFNNLVVGGTLTYEDVKNVDSVGIVTARAGIKVPDDQRILLGAANDLDIYHTTSGTSWIRHGNTSEYFVIEGDQMDFRSYTNSHYRVRMGTAVELRHNNTERLKTSSTGVTITGDITTSDKIIHAGDTDTAIRFPAADTVSVETAGQQNVQVDGTRVLLKSPSGTNTTVRLQHQGNSGYGDIILDRTVNAFIIDNDPGNAGSNGTYFSVKTIGSERLRITSDGKVGVGVAAPVGTFEIRDSKANLIVAKDGLTVKNNSDIAASYDLIQLGAGGALASYSTATATADTQFIHNAYRHSGNNWKYRYADTAARLRVNSPARTWVFESAASGSADGDITWAEQLRIDSSGRLLLGHTATIDTSTFNSNLQVMGTDAHGSSAIFGRFSADASSSSLHLTKSRNATKGSHTVVQDNDGIGNIFFWASDGGDYEEVARMGAEIDGTPGSGDTPGALTFHTTADGASTATERMRIHSNGAVSIANTRHYYGALNVEKNTAGSTAIDIKAAGTNAQAIAFGDHNTISGELRVTNNSILTLGTSSNHAFGFYTNGVANERLRITSNGSVNIGTGSLTQTDRMLNVYGGRIRVEGITTNSNTAEFYGNTASGQSYGLLVASGTTSGDQCAQFRGAGGTNYLKIRGDGYLECGSTVALKVPSGTTAQRPTGVNGMLRYNTSNNILEGYVNSAWSTISQDNLASNGSYANNTEAIADDLYVYWNCNSTSTTRTGGDSGAATHYGVTASSGKINNYWNRGTSTTNGIKLTSMPTSNNISICFWFIQTDNTIHSTSDGAKILTLHDGDCGSTSAPVLGYDGSNGTVLRAGGTGWVSTGTQIGTITTNTWYHIGITKSGNDWKYYFNGSLQHSPTESQCLASTWWISNYSRIGNNNNNNNHYHRGGIDEFAVWHRTLSATEISAIFTASNAGTPLI